MCNMTFTMRLNRKYVYNCDGMHKKYRAFPLHFSLSFEAEMTGKSTLFNHTWDSLEFWRQYTYLSEERGQVFPFGPRFLRLS